MLLSYLTEIKKSIPDDFKSFMASVENDIKVNRVAFGKKTSQQDFINICEILKGVYLRWIRN